MSCAYSTPFWQCKTSRDHVLLHHQDLDRISVQYLQRDSITFPNDRRDVSYQCSSMVPSSLDPYWGRFAYYPPRGDWSASRFHTLQHDAHGQCRHGTAILFLAAGQTAGREWPKMSLSSWAFPIWALAQQFRPRPVQWSGTIRKYLSIASQNLVLYSSGETTVGILPNVWETRTVRKGLKILQDRKMSHEITAADSINLKATR